VLPTLVSPQFYVAATVPDGFTMHFAETLGIGGNTAEFVNSDAAELWATQGATSTSGSWFVVSAGTHHATHHNAYRTTVPGLPVTVEHDPVSQQTRLSFDKDGEGIEIVAFGWADRQLLRLAHSVSLVSGQFRYNDQFFDTDHTLLMRADPSTAVYGLPVAWVGYTTGVPAALAENFTITVSGDPGTQWDIARRFALLPTSAVSLGRTPATAGRLATDPNTTVIQWRDGPRLVTLRGNVDLDRLREIAASVHPADSAAVTAAVDPDPPAAPVSWGTPIPVASGPAADPWSISVAGLQTQQTRGSMWLLGTTNGPATAYRSAGEQAAIETYADDQRTYVMARAPRAAGPLVLEINPTGAPTVSVPMTDVDPTSADTFAAYAFSNPVPYAAQILGDGRTVLASWPV
jgi:hypothetical protein